MKTSIEFFYTSGHKKKKEASKVSAPDRVPIRQRKIPVPKFCKRKKGMKNCDLAKGKRGGGGGGIKAAARQCIYSARKSKKETCLGICPMHTDEAPRKFHSQKKIHLHLRTEKKKGEISHA